MTDLRKLLDEATKGPWVRRGRKESKYDNGAWEFINADGWKRFARVVVRLDLDEQDNPEGVANARLIAMAPDLAAALLKAEEALAFYEDANNWSLNSALDANSANFTGGPASATLTEIRKLTGAA